MYRPRHLLVPTYFSLGGFAQRPSRVAKAIAEQLVLDGRDHSARLSSAAETIAKFYQLKPTELIVLLAIVEVGGAPEVAELVALP